MDSSDHLTDALHFGKPAEREQLLRRLGVEPETAHLAAAPPETGLQAEKIDGSDASLLYIPCSTTLKTAHLYLLGKGMRVTDDAPLSCWGQNAGYNFVFLPGHLSMAVLAHHSNASHGTGEVEDDMLLVEPRNAR